MKKPKILKTMLAVVLATQLVHAQLAENGSEKSSELQGQTDVLIGPAPTTIPEKAIEPYNPRTKMFFIKIQKAAEKVVSIVASLDSFLMGNLIAKNNEAMSLLDFEYRETPEVTVEAYERIRHFGGWVKNKKSGDCFNTRNKVLVRDNVGTIGLKEDNKCSVATGEWIDAYSGATMHDAQAEIQIDHMVPLREAYVSGAYKWTFKERCLYGNYLGYKNHLVSVSGEQNNEKSAKTPEDYMPPNKDYQCQYLVDWLKIKSFWGLSLAAEEMNAIKDLVAKNNCDTSAFTVTKKELEDQEKFFLDNAELCRVYEQNQQKDQQK